MKYLALDYGSRRVGVAVSDADGIMAFPRCTLKREIRAAFFADLLALIDAERPDAIVLGYPLYSDGSESLTTRQVRNFAASLKRRVPLPVYYMNEFLSSADAEKRLAEAGRNARAIKGRVDQAAAALILESFLSQPESLRKEA